MKMVSLVKNGIKQFAVMLGLLSVSVSSFAASNDTISNLGSFQGILSSNAGEIYRIATIIATLAGLILVIKGLVHLKQNYTGTGQEKHLSKGIASLGFGVALILAVPISHMLVGTVDSSESFTTNAGQVSFS